MTITARAPVTAQLESAKRRRADLLWLALALVCLIVGRVTLVLLLPEHSNDFDNLYNAALQLLRGQNPYSIAPQPSPLFYPLPAVFFAVPFTLLPLTIARPVLDMVVGAAFVFALWKVRGRYALLAVLSGSLIAAQYWGDLTPLMVAASLFPLFGFLLILRPNAGMALWLARPSRVAAIAGAAVLLLTFMLYPSWPRDWVRGLLHSNEGLLPIIFRPFGFVLLLAAIRVKKPEGRLLFALALIPQTAMPFELLPLALIPSNLKEMAVYVVGTLLTLTPSIAGLQDGLPVSAIQANTWPWMLVGVYLPMLWLVLRTPGKKAKVVIGKERRRANRLADEELKVDIAARPEGGFVAKVTHLPTGLFSSESGETRELAERKAHDKLAAILAEMRRARKKA
jgi:hypothetical protein